MTLSAASGIARGVPGQPEAFNLAVVEFLTSLA